jgi:hypothetical protein
MPIHDVRRQNVRHWCVDKTQADADVRVVKAARMFLNARNLVRFGVAHMFAASEKSVGHRKSKGRRKRARATRGLNVG